MKTSSVSSMKNNLSAHLKHVMAGETYLITDRNRAVAMLTPLNDGNLDARLESLAAEGLVQLRERSLDTESFLSLPKGRCSTSLSAAILEDREER